MECWFSGTDNGAAWRDSGRVGERASGDGGDGGVGGDSGSFGMVFMVKRGGAGAPVARAIVLGSLPRDRAGSSCLREGLTTPREKMEQR